MPGLVAFGRRWAVGSDDLVVPAAILIVINGVWIVIFVLTVVQLGPLQNQRETSRAVHSLWLQSIAYVPLLCTCSLVELCIAVISVQGSILNAEPRRKITYFLYARLALLFGQWVMCGMGILWLCNFDYFRDSPDGARALLGVVIWQLLVTFSVLTTMWLSYDPAGRQLIRLTKYQLSLQTSKRKYKRSGHTQRNWRKRRITLIYQQSWDKRLRNLCCCIGHKEDNRSSFGEVAKLFSEFFVDLDVVPTDIVAGLILLRRKQRQSYTRTIEGSDNDTYQFFSGMPINPRTKFLKMNDPKDFTLIRSLRYYMQYALGAYGWPFYMAYTSGKTTCRLFQHLSCCSCCCSHETSETILEGDNCCRCNLAALKLHLPSTKIDLIFASFHVAINESPFFVAVDHDQKSIIICIRGTLSLEDLVTDLTAHSEEIPLKNRRREFMAHKGTIRTAMYIHKRLFQDNVIYKALQKAGIDYQLILVGHSLGGGAATILGMILREAEFPDLICYCYSAPGGLLSQQAAEYSKKFVTCLAVGKDAVLRLGIAQMERLRSELLSLLKTSKQSKWKIIFQSFACCCDNGNGSESELVTEPLGLSEHPTNADISLSTHEPMYPPGQIIHIVRTWSRKNKKQNMPGYAAIWAENDAFKEVLISPTMIHDHMPDGMIEGIEKLMRTSELSHNGGVSSLRSSKVVPMNNNEDDRSTLLNYDAEMAPEAPLASPESTDGISFSITSSSSPGIIGALECNGNGSGLNKANGLRPKPTDQTRSVAPLPQKPKTLSLAAQQNHHSQLLLSATPGNELSTIYEVDATFDSSSPRQDFCFTNGSGLSVAATSTPSSDLAIASGNEAAGNTNNNGSSILNSSRSTLGEVDYENTKQTLAQSSSDYALTAKLNSSGTQDFYSTRTRLSPVTNHHQVNDMFTL